MNSADLQHGRDYAGQCIDGWYLSEKFRGCRAYWDGSVLWSRGGVNLTVPAGWQLPEFAIDCELYDGLDGERRVANAIRWNNLKATMRLMAFDAPYAAGSWSERMSCIPTTNAVEPVAFRVCQGKKDARSEFTRVVMAGGEGLMLRHPAIVYTAGRSGMLLKMK